ncbi:MAG: hypothetical protein ACI8P3_002956 [Saprospiraceae bacterium]|jgi:hypothetical protein
MKSFKNLFLHLILAITAISLHSQCPDQLSNTSLESEGGARLVLEYTAAPPIATQISIDFGIGDSRNGTYPVTVHNINLLRTTSQGAGFFDGDLNASITINIETCAFTETTPPDCDQWAGNCNIDDQIYRFGNVYIGSVSTPPGPLGLTSKLMVTSDVGNIAGISSISNNAISAYTGVSNHLTYPTLMLTNSGGGPAGWFDGSVKISTGDFTIEQGSFKLGVSAISRESDHLLINPSFKFFDDGTFDVSKISTLDFTSVNIVAQDIETAKIKVTDNFEVENITINSTLYVLEEMYAKKITVKLPPFPDYVFANNYDLMPLGDLRKYIKKNQHLPNIPSAEEIDENGADIGNLHVLQMEKIEELTLYILELNERLEKIEEGNKTLQQQLNNYQKVSSEK